MKLICAWCRQDIGRVEGSKLSDSEISHGICESCHDNIMFQQGVPLQKYLDSLPLPVLVVNDDVVVQAANRKACVFSARDRWRSFSFWAATSSSAPMPGYRKDAGRQSTVPGARSGERSRKPMRQENRNAWSQQP